MAEQLAFDTMPNPDRSIEMVWVDVETTGLDVFSESLLEVGIFLTDRWGNVVDSISRVCYDDSTPVALMKMDDWAHETHVRSGLLSEVNNLMTAHDESHKTHNVAEQLVDWLDEHSVLTGTMPMCGSSVHFDRAFLQLHMSSLEKNFYYRNMDVSTIKNVCALVNPVLYDKRPEDKKTHRVDDCLPNSIAEYKFYLDNFFFIED